jgi:oligopeptide/dipeptide ABC transporter ATP-binding protein
MTGADKTPLLSVDDLGVELLTERGWIPVISEVGFEVPAGAVVGLVGESGAGKSVTAMAINGLLAPRASRIVSGSVRFFGEDLLEMTPRQRNAIRGRRIGTIFQDPMTALNPAFTVGEQIAEVVREHEGAGRREALAKAIEAMDMVGIPSAARRAASYPHEFSGGMAQRVMIAMAIACRPQLLIADEPTTALDVTTQARILRLLKDIRRELGMGVLLVTHDLGIVADFCDEVVVMYAGEVVERSGVVALFEAPCHPYTAALIDSMPYRALERGGEMRAIAGIVPPAGRLPDGCRFHTRCGFALAPLCTTAPIPLVAGVRCARAGALDLRGTGR